MEPFTSHTGRGVPLRRSNVDTDQIIPAEYLKRVSRTGFGDGLFAAWREDPAFVLNQPAYAGATILIAGTDFGIGSSREHAVWALADYGFRVVIAPRFGDIFHGNATKAGLLPVRLPEETVGVLHDAAESDPAAEITVDLDGRTVSCPSAAAPGGGHGLSVPFEIDDYTRWRLMAGLDDIGLTLRHVGKISGFEQGRPPWLPVTGDRPQPDLYHFKGIRQVFPDEQAPTPRNFFPISLWNAAGSPTFRLVRGHRPLPGPRGLRGGTAGVIHEQA